MADASTFPPSGPPDDKGDDYDPRYDVDHDGKHNKEENDQREKIKKFSEGTLPPPVPGENAEYDQNHKHDNDPPAG